MPSDFSSAAAVCLMRPASGGQMEVYLVKRAAQQGFLASFWAFAGGRVDPGDHELTARLPDPDAARKMACLRELFEETGVLACEGRERVDESAREAWLKRPHTDFARWAELLATYKLAPLLDALVPLGSWLTPAFVARRFSATYFALWMPPGESAALLGTEHEAGNWVTPAQAVKEHEAGERVLGLPIYQTLLTLSSDGLKQASERLQARAEPDPSGTPFAPGIRLWPLRTNTLPPHTHTNCYVLGHRSLVIVDPGANDSAEQSKLANSLEQYRREGAFLTAILLTHAHPDHTAGVGPLIRQFDLPVWAHARTADAVRAQGISVSRLLGDNEWLSWEPESQWRVLHTPGHAPGHLCFHEEATGRLLCGDQLFGTGTPIVLPAPEGDMSAYLKSLRRLEALRPTLLFPGHGPPVAAVQHALLRTLAHRLAREQQVLQALSSGPQRLSTLREALYATLEPIGWGLAELTLQAHLEKLEKEGHVEKLSSHLYARVSAPSASAP